jgi:4-aminobutyrate aminotransferase-like enzyme
MMFQSTDWLTAPAVPRLVTPVPGPQSRQIFAAEQELQAAGTSAGSLWSQLAVVDGKGAMVRDADGNFLLDACSGTVVQNIGHGNEAVAAALGEQAARLTHFYDFVSPIRVDFLRALRSTLPPVFDAFHLLNSGTEAVETALRIVRSATGRHEIIAFHNAYHGRSLGALSLTTGAGRQGVGPLIPGVVHAPSPYAYRSPFSSDPEECAVACADHVETVVAQTLSAPPAAVFIEPVQGAGGTIPMPATFLRRLREFCDRTGAVLVFDEILTGAGRTGRMWAFEHSNVVPDLLLAGKGLAGGYPLGVVAGPRAIMDAGPVALPTHNSSTFGGGQLACAAGLAALAALRDGDLIANADKVGGYLLDRLRTTLADCPVVGDIRGLGLAIGVEMVTDRATKAPATADMSRRVLLEMLARGVVISSAGNVVRITPPLCLTVEQAEIIADVAGHAFSAVAQAITTN